MQKPAPTTTVRVWDLPTRLFHWTLVALLVFSFTTGHLGPIEWHMVSGKLVIALVLFRLAWGFVGGHHARFATFLAGPSACIGYAMSLLRGPGRHYIGHNPLGAWSIIIMLGLIALQAGTGLFSTDDIYTDGPLKYLVSDATSKELTHLHHRIVNFLLLLVGIHVAAALFYLFVRRDNLITPMITGSKPLAADSREAARGSGGPSAWLGAALAVLALAIVFGGLRWFGR